MILVNSYMLIVTIDSIIRKGLFWKSSWSAGNLLTGVMFFLFFNVFSPFLFVSNAEGRKVQIVFIISLIYFIVYSTGRQIIEVSAPVLSILLLILFWNSGNEKPDNRDTK